MNNVMMTRKGLWLILALFALLGLVYSVTIPLFEAPDELWHFNVVYEIAQSGSLPVQTDGVDNVWLREAGQPPLYHSLMALAITPFDRSDFPDFVRFNPDHPFVSTESDSTAANLFVHTDGEAFPYTRSVLAVHFVRLLTVLLGALTLLGVYFVVREVLPNSPGLALLATAVSAFNPGFIFISSVVNNDVAIAALATWTVWLAIKFSKGLRGWKWDLLLGFLFGLAIMSKLSGLGLLVVVVGGLFLRWWGAVDKGRGVKRSLFDPATKDFLLSGLIVGGTAVSLAGWWFVRNQQLYGDPLGWGIWLENIGSERATFLDLIPQFRDVGVSFWQPIGGLLPLWVLVSIAMLWVLALGGWGWLIGKRGINKRICTDNGALLLAAGWYIVLMGSLVQYMLILPAAAGRLLYPATAGISLLLVLGVASLWPQRLAKYGGVLGTAVAVALFLLSAATPVWGIAPLYPPARVQADALPDLMTIPRDEQRKIVEQTGISLRGMSVLPQEGLGTGPVDITLYWDVEERPPEDLRVVVQVRALNGEVLFQKDQPPAKEMYPHDLWQIGDIIRDGYRWLPEDEVTAVYSVWVTLFANGEEVGQLSSPLSFTHTADVNILTIPHKTSYKLGTDIELIGYDVASDEETTTVRLYWRALADGSEAYTAFIHLFAANGERLAQNDSPVANAAYPTEIWRAGDIIVDVRQLPVPVVEDGRFLIGMYTPADGTRLPITDKNGNLLPDGVIELPVP